ncbi:hypothetical protein CBP31_03385 [Oceanisphaera profunda]|uniref:Glycosyltransferase subfamily 4-like N-terminal domain-containing protein n=1 Tax=Oceanisphaera profunda TaxID=1416627 RepID=A0A1Y0D2N1_9GAMM|nr:glycosyltransferase [Oceanisphaera profunda]ART81780.1 hypothetical protein CBP31_03385 [Oceanisphaera profunda]
MKVLHIITGLGDGGAEGVLYRLCTQDKSNTHIVVSLMGAGKYSSLLINNGIRVELLNQKKGRMSIQGLFYLYRLIKKIRPNVVQTWMYHSDLIGGVLAKLLRVEMIVWNIRHSSLEPGKANRSTIIIANLCGKISRFIPDKIICCAQSASESHKKYGYDSSKMIVIENGYELSRFKPAPQPSLFHFPVQLGMVGRYTQEKDHINLLKAIKILVDNGYSLSLALVGSGMDKNNHTIVSKIDELGLTSYVFLMGARVDIPSVMRGLDIHLLSSSSEGFPNVLAEAMACGTPCVTTDAGDAAAIVGDTGWVVKIKDSNGLAMSIMKAIDEMTSSPNLWMKRKEFARARIVESYSIDSMVGRYNQVWNG